MTAILGLALALATWLAVEAVSFAGFSALQRSPLSPSKVAAEMAVDATPRGAAAGISGRTSLRWNDYVEVLHPYFGFVGDPDRTPANWAVSDFGFPFDGDTPAITRRAPGRLVVAVFGGSFANGAYPSLKALFEAKAAELGKDVRFVNFSSGGYKQPQQLMVLNYLMALGAQFDVVINIDGFNEVALPAAENIPDHVNPFFPRDWAQRTADTINPEDVRRVGYQEFLEERRAAWAGFFSRNHLYLSPTLCLVWRLRDEAMSRAIYAAGQAVAVRGAGSKSYAMRGPAYSFADENQLFRDLAGVWRNSSEQMNDLCAARGTLYFHFLQPNQYVPGSKPMGAGERKLAVREGHPYQHGVVMGYPVLRGEGARLKAGGVRFTDLTQIFADEPRPMYKDDCCHLNDAGYDIVAARVFDTIFGARVRAN